MKRKTKAIILVCILHIPLLIPIHVRYKDGGSHEWRAIAWQYTSFHKIADESGYIVGSRLTLFGVLTVFDSRHIEYLDE